MKFSMDVMTLVSTLHRKFKCPIIGNTTLANKWTHEVELTLFYNNSKNVKLFYICFPCIRTLTIFINTAIK
jgi:hypothetical protein